jgi:membrane fusion protein (multidrug efflux system)
MQKTMIAIAGMLLAVVTVYSVLKWQDRDLPWSEASASPAQEQNAPRRAAPVEVALSKAGVARTELNSIGTLVSDESVAIASEVAGRISEIFFKEGQPVKAGQVLIKLDDAFARADLATADAAFDLAQSNLQRATSLSRSGAGTGRALDEAQAARASAQAQRELARVRLDKMEIRAPFAGVVGLRTVSEGAYAQIGQTLVNLEKIDTLKLDFRLPEVNLQDVAVGMTVTVTADAFPGEKFTGSIFAIDPLVDVNGRAVRIRARLDNVGARLRPGLFARVTVQGKDRGQVVMVPEGAVVPRGQETFVYRVADGQAQETRVKLGRRMAGSVEVLEGLAADTQIVTAGQGRLRNGASVEVVSSAGPV